MESISSRGSSKAVIRVTLKTVNVEARDELRSSGNAKNKNQGKNKKEGGRGEDCGREESTSGR